MTYTLWPAGASPEYVAARTELAHAERRLRDEIERVAAARRALPPGALLPDYVLAEGPADLAAGDGPVVATPLTELFAGHPTLVVYHLMFHPDDAQACPMCSMWVDGFQGVAPHLARHTGFAVVAKAPLAKLRPWGRARGWTRLRLLSSHDSTFNADLGAESPDGAQRPVISVFTRDGDRVRHGYSQSADFIDGAERGIDPLSPVWSVLDLLPGGRGDWYAENGYVLDATR